jgi:hypothetical protein
MAEGTKKGGINCIYMHTNIKEFDIPDGKPRQPFFEIVRSNKENVAFTSAQL